MAIHPFWFKEFGLDRWCMKDVCLSVWLPDRSHDLMFKITDVCDPADCPGACWATQGRSPAGLGLLPSPDIRSVVKGNHRGAAGCPWPHPADTAAGCAAPRGRRSFLAAAAPV